MYYPRYFKLGQSISLERVFLDPGNQNQCDRLSAQVASCDDAGFVVHFPYGTRHESAGYPFFPGMPFNLHSEYHGLGIRTGVSFEEMIADGLIRLQPVGGLEFYYLKELPRISIITWIGIDRRGDSLLSMRRRWRRQSQSLGVGEERGARTPFAKATIELGEDGLILSLDTPASTSELMILHLALNDGKPVICILGEIVRVEEAEGEGQRATLHFINILEEDQLRIKRYLKNLG